ncbi:MAG: DNA-directed RNA polymerase subunit RPC12/RpoP [Paracoccaceae bacterium]|jgi:DNA-directed RNA polymerase subunit RPC12/RpoP
MSIPPPPPTELPQPSEAGKPLQEHRFPCEACGSDLRFAPGKDGLICDHCGHAQQINEPVPTGTIQELDFRRALEARLPEAEIEETRVLNCESCGAQVEFDSVTHARECPFCATPVVADSGTHRHIKPKGLLPFALTQDQSRDAMANWLGSLWFAPNGLQEYARKGRKMQGIYVPYWTFDADTKSRYSGQRGTIYYETRTRSSKDGGTETYQVQKIRWIPVSGRVARWFDDVLVLASKSLPAKFTDALEPWDLAALEPYRPEYLAGFRAEGYAVELPDGYDAARIKMDQIIQRDVKFDIGGDRQRITNLATDVSDVTFKHILLPVWLAAYKYRGKSYRFVVNGRSGRVQGERPYSAVKIGIAILFGAIVAGAIGYGVAMQQ